MFIIFLTYLNIPARERKTFSFVNKRSEHFIIEPFFFVNNCSISDFVPLSANNANRCPFKIQYIVNYLLQT